MQNETWLKLSYLYSSLKGRAALWFDNLSIDPAITGAGSIGTLAALCTAFEAQYLFDPAQKRRYLSDFFKIKQQPGEKVEEYMNIIKEAGIKCRADEEQIRDATIAGFLSFIQGSVSNHDMEPGQIGMQTTGNEEWLRFFSTGFGD